MLTILLIVLNFSYYSSINKTFAKTDEIKEIKTTIIKVEEGYMPKATESYYAKLYFIGSDGEEYCVECDYLFLSDDDILPAVSDKMIVKETPGAFNYALYEFVEIVP